MKKVVSFLLIIFVVFSFTSCSAEKIKIDDCEWKMSTIMSNDAQLADSENVVIAVGEPDDIYPNATVVNITLTASNGKITVTDKTNNQVYYGGYKVTQNTPRGTDYEIEINGQNGYATVAPTKHYSGEEIPTLPINLGEYTIYFIPNK